MRFLSRLTTCAMLAVFSLSVALVAVPQAEAAPSLFINGKAISGEQRPVIYGGRILVPARVVAENLGAKVEWLKAEETVKVTGNNKTMLLPVKSSTIKIDGNSVKIDSPVMIINNRSYVPLRIIAETLGATVSWDKKSETARIDKAATVPDSDAGATTPPPADTPPVQEIPQLPEGTVIVSNYGVHTGDSGYTIFAVGDGPLDVKYVNQTATTLTYEIHGAYLASGNAVKTVNRAGITTVSLSQISTTPALVRIVFNTELIIPHTLRISDATKSAGIDVPFQLTSTAKVTLAGREAYAVKTNGPLDCSAFQSSDKIYTLEFPGTSSNIPLAELTPDSSIVEEIKVTTTGTVSTGLKTRVDFHLKRHLWGRISPASNMIYVEFSPDLQVAKVTTEQGKTRVSFKFSEEIGGNYRIGYTDTGISVFFPYMAWGLATREIKTSDRLVKALQYEYDRDFPRSARVKIAMDGKLKYQIVSSADDELIIDVFSDKVVFDTSVAGKRIVLDPGHGGKDSGAVAVDGHFEKDYNLAVANFLFQKLNQAGANVMMTRQDDKYLTLAERVTYANSTGADIFVSIHFNSATNRDASGTETYYYSNAPQAQRLAAAIQRHAVAATGLPNRGVKTNMFYVINHTTMPGALIEVAFVSNSRDNALSQQPQFQNKVAQAMFQGIVDYFAGK